MRMRWLGLVALAAMIFGTPVLRAPAAQDKDHAQDKEAIAKNAEGFLEAFHKGDAKGVASFWAKDGDYTDQ